MATSNRERFDRLRLYRSQNVGPITFRRLLAHFGSAGAAIDALPALARRGGRGRPIKVCPAEAAEGEIEALKAAGGRYLIWGDAEYPAALANIEDAPPVLSPLGHAHLLERRALAIVGARNASANGRRFARAIAAELGQAGFVVASGLARGIDAAAHEGALESGSVAVVAGGVDMVYPKENRALHEAIAERGAILAELPPGTTPQGRHFPYRNRIISGLSLGTLVIEAAMRSGSLITARYALDQGREVFAVPGSPLDPRCRGTNDLIRQGAVLTESAADVVGTLEGIGGTQLDERRDDPYAGPVPSDVSAADQRAVTELLGHSPVPVDEIIRQCQLSPATVSTVLLELELAGRLERHPGNQVSIV